MTAISSVPYIPGWQGRFFVERAHDRLGLHHLGFVEQIHGYLIVLMGALDQISPENNSGRGSKIVRVHCIVDLVCIIDLAVATYISQPDFLAGIIPAIIPVVSDLPWVFPSAMDHLVEIGRGITGCNLHPAYIAHPHWQGVILSQNIDHQGFVKLGNGVGGKNGIDRHSQ